MNESSMTILFNSKWEPSFLFNGKTDSETAKLQELAGKIVKAIREREESEKLGEAEQ